jgi:hypothetical protein
MSEAAVDLQNNSMPEDPQAWREEFRRRMAERGVCVRLPHPDATWQPPEHPLPFTADEMSQFVVELRRSGKL